MSVNVFTYYRTNGIAHAAVLAFAVGQLLSHLRSLIPDDDFKSVETQNQ